MATIAKVLTQESQPAVGPAADAAGGDINSEFLALLSDATGALPTPPLPTPPVPTVPRVDLAPAGDEPPATTGTADLVAASLVALVTGADPRRAEPAGAAPAQAALVDVSERAAGRMDLQARLPDPAASLDVDASIPARDARSAPAVTLPVNASPVAVTVLAPQQAGQRPVPHVAAVRQHADAPARDPAPPSEAIARMADANAEIAAADLGAQAEPDGGDTPAGTAGQAASAGPLVRDASVAAAHVRTLPATVGTPAWQHALGAEVRLMIERGVGAATLRLSPEHLGPVEVRIDLADDSANVWFTAPHPDTRAALADALPRLRDMLASVGVTLGEAGVHRDMPGEPDRRDGARAGGTSALAEPDAESRVVVARLDAGRGLVDEYA
jgi:flagellar hook-length control protein FliK